MSICQFEKRLRHCEQLRPYRRLTTMSYSDVESGDGDGTDTQQQWHWWPWQSNPT